VQDVPDENQYYNGCPRSDERANKGMEEPVNRICTLDQKVQGFEVDDDLRSNEGGPGEMAGDQSLTEKAGTKMKWCKWHRSTRRVTSR